MPNNFGDQYGVQRAFAVHLIARNFDIPSNIASDVLGYSENLVILGEHDISRTQVLLMATSDTIIALTALALANGRAE